MSCPNCGREVGSVKFCRHCGAVLESSEPASLSPAPPRAESSRGPWAAAAVVLLLVAGWMGWHLYREPPSEPVAATAPAPELPLAAIPARAVPPPTPARPPTVERVERRARPATPGSTPIAESSPPPAPARPEPALPETAPASGIPTVPAPVASRPARPRVELFRPEPASPPEPAAPAYTGPSAGTLIWSGQIERNTLVTINGDQVSFGRLTGELPGIPVTIELATDAFAMVESPGPANNWKRLSLRSLRRIRGAVVIRWGRQ